MKIKTAVEILEISLLGIVSFDSEVLRNKYKESFKIAKEMEKQNIKQAYNDGKAAVINIKNNMSLEEYYDKTFKNETK
jgi:septum formation inhibitor-activating ATPase MinD